HTPLLPYTTLFRSKVVGGALDRLGDRRVRMPGAAHGNAGGEVQEAIAIDVPDLDAAPARHHEGVVARIGGRAHDAIARQQGAGVGSRELGADVGRTHGEILSVVREGAV